MRQGWLASGLPSLGLSWEDSVAGGDLSPEGYSNRDGFTLVCGGGCCGQQGSQQELWTGAPPIVLSFLKQGGPGWFRAQKRASQQAT